VNSTRRRMLIASALATALAASAPAAASAARAEIKLRKTKVGTILVNSKGFTVYAFTRDPRNRDMCAALRGCPSTWPAVITAGKPIAGHGVKSSLLGTINLRGGRKQVTYAGHPLYTYIGDSAPGETSYVNFRAFGGRWPAMNASGHEVTSAPKPQPMTPAPQPMAPAPGYGY
jgi:predicted lipoprotein with Yx(FWY)xxD motif